ncbi:MAG: NADPH:quinone oxidoreductase [Cellvibrionales bacterium TMED49]|nr:NADPH:quinone oxidoreductase [Porticoccaceae bacterium]OUU35560.1 MAG: NADPH:quinone oxidoreductase [Cellvibrionales bacterium TMED49]|tara:strand:+ start:359 stop:1333 length:975 start_codon:yes stop_codon:yes gene_type:complete
MRALTCNEFGPTKNLVLKDQEKLEPGDGEVLIDVKAAGVNFPDILTIEGKYQFKPTPPFVPGGEVSGVVSKIGRGVTTRVIGDEVFATMQTGGFAEQVVTSEYSTFLKGSLSFEQAAGFAITYGTSYYALKQRAELKLGESVLVLGAAGGVGIACIQIAKAMGAKIIAAASTEAKLDFAVEAGADLRVNYSCENLKETVKKMTKGKGADIIYDPVGGELAEEAFRAVAWDGRFLVIGFASGPIPRMPLNLALLKGASLVGVFWGSWAGRDPVASQKNFKELVEMVDQKKFSPLVTEVYPLDEFSEAFECISQRRARGKVVLAMV